MLKIGRFLPLVMDVLKAFQQIHNFLVACVYKGTAHTEGFCWRAQDKCQDWVFFSSLLPWLWCKNFVFPKMRYNSPREKDEQFGLWKREGMGCFPCPLFCSCHNKSIMEIVVQEARTKSIQSFKKIKLSNIWLASSSSHERLKSVLCNQFNALLQSRFYCVLTTCQKWVFGLDISGYVLSEN